MRMLILVCTHGVCMCVCVCVSVCVCAKPLVLLSVVHVICCVVDWGALRCADVAFTRSLKVNNNIILVITDKI